MSANFLTLLIVFMIILQVIETAHNVGLKTTSTIMVNY